MKLIFLSLFSGVALMGFSQTPGPLTIEKIMQDPKWIGTSPSNVRWGLDSRTVYFNWNQEKALADSLYFITTTNHSPVKASVKTRQELIADEDVVYNQNRSAWVAERNGDIFYSSIKDGTERRITQTVDAETRPVFINNETAIAFIRNQNAYAFHLASGLTEQLTHFVSGNKPSAKERDQQEEWLYRDQLAYFEVLRLRKMKKDSAAAMAKKMRPELHKIYTGDKNVSNITVSPAGNIITYQLTSRPSAPRSTIVPNYVTESGYTENLTARPKVGTPLQGAEYYIFNRALDTLIKIDFKQLPRINEVPAFTSTDTSNKYSRRVIMNGPFWNDAGTRAVVSIRSTDNKDLWLMELEATTGKLKLLDKQRDEAWIAGPGIGSYYPSFIRWIDDETFYFNSEETGYSHLYTMNINSGKKTAITKGNFEVKQTRLSNDKKWFYIITNQVHPGEQHLYKVTVQGGKPVQLTSMPGAHQVKVSPDDKQLAVLYSYSNKPWELYLQENKPGARPKQITSLAQSPEFAAHTWMEPEIVTFTARDGATVYARLYKPSTAHTSKPAVIFVHGAGYLQNVHRWWSQYYREYMFHNLLAQEGYMVLDIDYRGSEGYGRNWRTGIYRHMGGKDLTDQVDGAKYLVEQHGINEKNIGIYGGSYGGFITLMAMFNQPGVFAAGAALRSVTDWAHYNHGYTSNILNQPFADTIAYRLSSPIYHAEGLQGALLMCHGMVDVNVHFQDIVRLTQRLIELKKENWELAVYPVEDHAFTEPTSWMDEYKRIFKLFETNLKK